MRAASAKYLDDLKREYHFTDTEVKRAYFTCR